jgi:hypothetical protein
MATLPDTPSFAIIDGTLCKLDRHGTVMQRMPPLGGSPVAEFHRLGTDVIVREQVGGVLAGISNLYRIREDFGLDWLAQLPSPRAAYAAILEVGARHILCRSTSGGDVRLDPRDGTLQP